MGLGVVHRATSIDAVGKMSVLQFVFLVILVHSSGAAEEIEMDFDGEDQHSAPEPIDGRSFFFLGSLFRRWRNRWMAYHNPDPMFAGPAYPISGYYNCPVYGCNPAAIGPQPGYYATPAGFYTMPLNQQQAQGNSNVYIYQSDQNSASAGGPLGYGYIGGVSPLGPATPLPLPPPGLTPPSTINTASASASGYSRPGGGPGQRPGPFPIPLPQLG
ncbi:uncharacterized protein LOC108031251 [Drosophila biarmipes]|uniref:uncharacterized protein LOC108031251 n=1 Tax=Drosophila biarmipes TaxID=125945 RepID=UPI0007E87CA1|nr:uncharacterized protein LOC108031251 [Drosophila biarmipes]XP_016959979.1 uncharacterized protein LOC108031251 [Drosophila biarmipes]